MPSPREGSGHTIRSTVFETKVYSTRIPLVFCLELVFTCLAIPSREHVRDEFIIFSKLR